MSDLGDWMAVEVGVFWPCSLYLIIIMVLRNILEYADLFSFSQGQFFSLFVIFMEFSVLFNKFHVV